MGRAEEVRSSVLDSSVVVHVVCCCPRNCLALPPPSQKTGFVQLPPCPFFNAAMSFKGSWAQPQPQGWSSSRQVTHSPPSENGHMTMKPVMSENGHMTNLGQWDRRSGFLGTSGKAASWALPESMWKWPSLVLCMLFFEDVQPQIIVVVPLPLWEQWEK